MRIITDRKEMNQTLKTVDKALEETCGPAQDEKWTFPDGFSDPFPTRLPANGRLVVGFSTERKMKSGRPIILALDQSTPPFTSTVELNIPPQANRRVQGCFARDANEELWLCHRGSLLTVQAYQRKRLTKKVIHWYFDRWLIDAWEQIGTGRDKKLKVIRVAPLPTPHLHRYLLHFANHVAKLKNTWGDYEGDFKKMRRFTKPAPRPSSLGIERH
jgi:hypothetical protein